MKRVQPWIMVIVAGAAAACATAPERGTAETAPPSTAAGAYTDADVAFMTNMIHHHAQALLMAGWAKTHDASPRLQLLAERVEVSQKDEIALMQQWLRQRGEPVPAADPEHTRHHFMNMPGMLSVEQLSQLDAARGAEFDLLFLTFMIQHHQGAITMAEELFRTPGSGQEDTVFRFASDVFADQQAEIDRMQQMLDTMTTGGS